MYWSSPSVMATTAITEETPIRIPSTVRKERSLLARSDANAMRTASENGMSGPPLVALDLAVADVDRPVRVLGDVALVGDDDDGVAVLVKLLEQPHDLLARGRVQVPRGLVGEQDRGAHDQGAGDGHALALPAGQLVRLVRDARAEVDHLQGLARLLEPLLLGEPRVDERELDVVERGRAGQQVEGLEDEPDLAVADGGKVVVVHLRHELAPEDVLAAGGGVQAADEVH